MVCCAEVMYPLFQCTVILSSFAIMKSSPELFLNFMKTQPVILFISDA